jgi:toxin CcdB
MAAMVIRHLDVFDNPSARSKSMPYLVVIQATILDNLETVAAAPLARIAPLVWPASLTPRIRFADEDLTLLMHQIGAVPRRALKPAIGSLASERERILRALDTLWAGQ